MELLTLKTSNMYSKNNISKLLGSLIIILALTFSTSSYALGSDDDQSSAPSNDSGSNDSGSNEGSASVPLDGGLSILLLGAAAFGVKKLRDNKK
jgi:hypothetical protein